MVLPHKVGKERSFGIVVLLYVVTFGIYGIYWFYKTHDEVFKQFELQQEGKDEGIVWFILGLILFQPLLFVYQYIFVSNVRHVRERFGFKKNLGAGGFLGLSIGGNLLSGVGMALFFVFLGFLTSSASDLDMSQSDLDAFRPVAAVLVGLGLLLGLAGFGLVLLAYGKLQQNVNGLWRAYDKRMAQINRPAATAPGAPSIAGTVPRQPPGPPW